jgi:hypothetical protein
MNRKAFYFAILNGFLYAFALGYVFYVNFSFLEISLLVGEKIYSEIISIIILIIIAITHVIAMFKFYMSTGKRKRLLLVSGGLGTLYVLLYVTFRLIESFFLGRLYFSFFSGHFFCLFLAVLTMLFSNKTYSE